MVAMAGRRVQTMASPGRPPMSAMAMGSGTDVAMGCVGGDLVKGIFGGASYAARRFA